MVRFAAGELSSKLSLTYDNGISHNINCKTLRRTLYRCFNPWIPETEKCNPQWKDYRDHRSKVYRVTRKQRNTRAYQSSSWRNTCTIMYVTTISMNT